MRVASLVVRIRPGTEAAVSERLIAVAGVGLHGSTPDGGRLIVMVEDGDGYSMADSLVAVSQTPGVLGVTLAYEYVGEDEEAKETEEVLP